MYDAHVHGLVLAGPLKHLHLLSIMQVVISLCAASGAVPFMAARQCYSE